MDASRQFWSWAGWLLVSLFAGGSALQADTVNIEDYFPLNAGSYWQYTAFGGGATDDDFRWDVLGADPGRAIAGTGIKTTTVEPDDDRSGDIDYWQYTAGGELRLMGIHKGIDVTSGPVVIFGNHDWNFSQPLVFGRRNWELDGAPIVSSASTEIATNFGTFTATVTASVRARPLQCLAVPTMGGFFRDVLPVEVSLDLTLLGNTRPFRQSTFFLAPAPPAGVGGGGLPMGMVAQNQAADVNDAQLHGVFDGRVGATQVVAPTGCPANQPILTISVGGSVSIEAGSVVPVDVSLPSQPTADVMVDISSDDPGEATVSVPGAGGRAGQMTFTPDNWDVPQQALIQGVDDGAPDGDQPYTISFDTTSNDAAYDGIHQTLDMISVQPRVVVTAVDMETGEDGDTGRFLIQLNAQPTAAVEVTAGSNTPAEGVVIAALAPLRSVTVTFDGTNWDQPIEVIVQGQDDDVDDGDQAYAVLLGVSSTDTRFVPAGPVNVPMTNLDDDTAAVQVIARDQQTSEGDPQDKGLIDVVLASKPLSPVNIHLVSRRPAEGEVTAVVQPASGGRAVDMVFTQANWNEPQRAVVTGVDDDVDDDDQVYAIAVQINSLDPRYSLLPDPADVPMTNLDDDDKGVVLTPLDSETSESDPTDKARIALVLTSQPLGPVVITADTDDATEGDVTGVSTTGGGRQMAVTFRPDNWNVPQIVIITGVDDPVDDGDITYHVTFTISAPTDPKYANQAFPALAVVNLDDDTAGFTIQNVDGESSETGDEASFDVALSSRPMDTVTVQVGTSDSTEGAVAGITGVGQQGGSTIVFGPGNWHQLHHVVVGGVDDPVDDGDVDYQATLTVTQSNDPVYAALIPGQVALTNLDDDTAGVSIAVTDGETSEAGDAGSLSIVLDTQPTGEVEVTVQSGDTTEGVVDAQGGREATVQFRTDNWSVPQVVTVAGQNDDVDDGDVSYQILFEVTGNDPIYDRLHERVDLTQTMVNLDDGDTAGVTAVLANGDDHTGEDGDTALLQLSLDTEPTAAVTLTVTSLNTAEGEVSVAVVRSLDVAFDATDWDVPKTVTVTGVDDDVDDGDIAYVVRVEAASTDGKYGGLADIDVALVNDDDDTAAVEVIAVDGDTETDEGGDTAALEVVLGSEPTAEVTVTVSSDDAGEGTVAAGGGRAVDLAFDAGNWDVPQTVTVTGQNDDIDDGDVVYAVRCAAASADAVYAGLADVTIDLTNGDDDEAGLEIVGQDFVTDENGDAAVFQFRLQTEPVAPVTVMVGPTDLTEGKMLAPGGGVATGVQLIFDAANWHDFQEATVVGQDDAEEDGDEGYTFSATFASDDPVYDALAPAGKVLTNLDNDSHISGTVSYAGPQLGDLVVEAWRQTGDGRAEELAWRQRYAVSDAAFDQAYDATNLLSGDYRLLAFRDANGNDVQDAMEPPGEYQLPRADTVTVPPSQTGIDFVLTNPELDGDGDGLRDWWELFYLGTLDFGSDDDPDNDGRTNADEQAAGSDPGGWRFRIASDVIAAPELFLGMQMGADAGLDKWDVAAGITPGPLQLQFETAPGLWTDVRPVAADEAAWFLAARPTVGREDVTLSWDASDVPPGRALLLDEVDEAGDPVPGGVRLDLGHDPGSRAVSLALASDETRFFRIRFVALATQTILMLPGWNLVSLYVVPEPGESSVDSVLDNTQRGAVWGWRDGRYVALDAFTPLAGAWAFRDGPPVAVEVVGHPLLYADKTISFARSWNLNGPADDIGQPVAPGWVGSPWQWTGQALMAVPANSLLGRGEAYWFYVDGAPFDWNSSGYE